MSPISAQPNSEVVVLGTGGTISGRAGSAEDNLGYVAGMVGAADLLIGIKPPVGITLSAEQLAQLDSKDMDFDVWRLLVVRCAELLAQPHIAGIVVTHGTDTLEETAFFLQAVLRPSKPVVLTCAMRPASALAPDGPQNLRDAISVAATIGASGVTVVCAGVVHGSDSVQKVHTYRLNAFSSADSCPVAYVEEGQLKFIRNWPETPMGIAQTAIEKIAKCEQWPRVEIVMSHAGATGALVDALVRERELATVGADPIRGLVIAATGNGTVHHALEAAAKRAQTAGIAVVRATRCAEGRILPRAGDAVSGGLRDAGDLSPVKARVALILELLHADEA